MIYLYGIMSPDGTAHSTSALAGMAGVTGQVALASCGDRVLIFSPHDGGEILPRRKLLLSHARVLEAAMEAGTVLPMRFGMTCQSVDEFCRLVETAHKEIKTGIDRLSGCAEVGVRVFVEETEALEAAVSAVPALKDKRDRLARAGNEAHFAKVEFGRFLGDTLAARRKKAQSVLLETLRPLCVDHVLKAPETDFEALRAEFLVRNGQMSEFSKTLSDVTADLEFAGTGEATARLVGPGPAFHFVDLALDTVAKSEVA